MPLAPWDLRPVLVLSEDLFNQRPADLVVVIPLTTRIRGIPTHVLVEPPEGGVHARSVILCEAIRSISKDRLTARWGLVKPDTMASVEGVLRFLLRL